MFSVIVGATYARCLVLQIPNSVMIPVGMAPLLTMIVLSERSILRRQHLTVAQRQVGRPSLDGFKDLAGIVRTSEGKKVLLSWLVFILVMFGGTAAWRPIILELRKVLPAPVCQKIGRPSQSTSG